MKVLIVDANATRASSVAEALVGSGAAAAVAPSASFALTMLEWNRQDVIISRAHLGDMDGSEFCAMVRSDPSTSSIRFVLVANDVTPAQMAQHGIDLVIPEGLIGHAIVTRVMHLMRRDLETPVARSAAATTSGPAPAAPGPLPAPMALAPMPAASLLPPVESTSPVSVECPAVPVTAALEPMPSPAPPVPVESPLTVATPAAAVKGAAPPPPPLTELEAVGVNGATRTFQGALGALALEDLAQAIASGSKTGRLLLVLETGGGMIAFDNGRIVHAEIGNTTGETAFQSLVAAAHRDRGGKFCFIPSAPRDLANVPKTITRSVADLLVGDARTMDEER